MKRKSVIFEIFPEQTKDNTAQLAMATIAKGLPPAIRRSQVLAFITDKGFTVGTAKHFTEEEVISFCEETSGYTSQKNLAKVAKIETQIEALNALKEKEWAQGVSNEKVFFERYAKELENLTAQL